MTSPWRETSPNAAEAPLEPAEAPPLAPAGPALVAVVESLLFVAPSPAQVSRIAAATGATEAAIQEAIAALGERCAQKDCGLRIVRRGDRVHLTTAPEAAPFVERLLGLDLTTRLSSAALETLAVIAYKQPLTRADIEAVRGVSCDGVLRTLIARDLVEPTGRLEQPGRPYLYGTTLGFLHYFGVESLEHLPPLPDPSTA